MGCICRVHSKSNPAIQVLVRKKVAAFSSEVYFISRLDLEKTTSFKETAQDKEYEIVLMIWIFDII